MSNRKRTGWAKRQDPADGALDYSTAVRRQEGQTIPVPVALDIEGDRQNRDALLVDHGRVRPDPEQPRRTMDRDALRELAGSIIEHGMMQPIVVREDTPDQHGDNRYVIVAGGRRWAAVELALAGEAGALDEVTRQRLRRVPILLDRSDGTIRRIRQLIENIQRQALPPVEEARAIRELMQLERLSAREIARRLHKSHPYVNDRLGVLDEEAISQAVEGNLLSFTAATELRKITDTMLRQQLLQEVRAGRHLRVADVRALQSPSSRPRANVRRVITEPDPATVQPDEQSGQASEWKITFHPDDPSFPPVGAESARSEATIAPPGPAVPGSAGEVAPPADTTTEPHAAATDAWLRHVAKEWSRWLDHQAPTTAAELRAAINGAPGGEEGVPDWWTRLFPFLRQVLSESRVPA